MLLHAEKWRNWTTLVPPEIPEPIRRELRIANNMLDVLVSHPRLDGRRIDAQIQRPRIENISTGSLVADEQRNLIVELLLHCYSAPPCAMAENWTNRDLGLVKNGQVYAERLARLRFTRPKQ